MGCIKRPPFRFHLSDQFSHFIRQYGASDLGPVGLAARERFGKVNRLQRARRPNIGSMTGHVALRTFAAFLFLEIYGD
jgi:hypothetical protein